MTSREETERDIERFAESIIIRVIAIKNRTWDEEGETDVLAFFRAIDDDLDDFALSYED